MSQIKNSKLKKDFLEVVTTTSSSEKLHHCYCKPLLSAHRIHGTFVGFTELCLYADLALKELTI